MSAMASQITGVAIVRSTACSGADQRKHKKNIIGLDNGLSPNRRQAITWANAEPIHSRKYAAVLEMG